MKPGLEEKREGENMRLGEKECESSTINKPQGDLDLTLAVGDRDIFSHMGEVRVRPDLSEL